MTASGRVQLKDSNWPVLALALTGAAVAVVLGVYGHVHTPAAQTSTSMVFWSITFESSRAMLAFKTLLTSVIILLAMFQVGIGLRLRDRLSWPRVLPLWLGDLHRLVGTLVLIMSLPVAYHCLWSLGFKADLANSRAFVHSLFGCFFYGAYVTKMLAVRRGWGPDWFIPAIGGALFSILTVLWLSSAFFFITGKIG